MVERSNERGIRAVGRFQGGDEEEEQGGVEAAGGRTAPSSSPPLMMMPDVVVGREKDTLQCLCVRLLEDRLPVGGGGFAGLDALYVIRPAANGDGVGGGEWHSGTMWRDNNDAGVVPPTWHHSREVVNPK